MHKIYSYLHPLVAQMYLQKNVLFLEIKKTIVQCNKKKIVLILSNFFIFYVHEK